jgi:tyrosinase
MYVVQLVGGKSVTNISRKAFLGCACASVAAAFIKPWNETPVTGQALRVRKDVERLDANGPEIKAFKAGVVAMRQLDPSDFRGWEAQATIHNDFCPHGNWFFLPWHRAYLYYFEAICGSLAGVSDFALPYWDWSENPRMPAVFWGEGNPLLDRTRRNRPDSTASSEFVGKESRDDILRGGDFLTFASGVALTQRQSVAAGELEARPHNYIHGTFVRGNMGGFMSPRDPIFWLHHANIDRLWTQWVLRHPKQSTNDTRWINFELEGFKDMLGKRVNRSVASLLSTYSLGYRYDDQPETPSPNAFFSEVKMVPTDLRLNVEVNKRARPAETIMLTLPEKATVTAALKAPIKVIGQPNALSPAVRVRIVVDRPATSEIGLRVFLGAGDMSNRSLAHPSYIGTVTFFGQEHVHASTSQERSTSFVLNATAAVQGLLRNNSSMPLNQARVAIQAFSLDETEINVVPEVNIREFSLEVVRDN